MLLKRRCRRRQLAVSASSGTGGDIWRIVLSRPIDHFPFANVTSSTKPEIHNVSQRRHRKTSNMDREFGEIWICRSCDMCVTDRQTDRQTDRHAHHNTASPTDGGAVVYNTMLQYSTCSRLYTGSRANK